MFCPLCNAEYRVGFSECGECKVALLETLEEAKAARIGVWKGESERDLDEVLDALASAGLRYHYHEGLSAMPRIVLSSIPVRPRLELEMWVLRDDQERAEAAIRELHRNDEDDEEPPTGSMFCPLCKAEYRPGFTQCSDCHTPLVGSRKQAGDVGICLWRGASQSNLDSILRALDDAGIASHYKELVNAQPRLNVGFDLLGRKPTFEYEVWVFAADEEKARAAIAALT